MFQVERPNRLVRVTNWVQVIRLRRHPYPYFIVDAPVSLPLRDLIEIFGACTFCVFGFQTSYDNILTSRRQHQTDDDWEWEANTDFAEYRRRRLQMAYTYRVPQFPRIPISSGDTLRLPRKPLNLPYSVGDSYYDADNFNHVDLLPQVPGIVIRCRPQFPPGVKFGIFLAAIAHHFRFQCIDN